MSKCAACPHDLKVAKALVFVCTQKRRKAYDWVRWILEGCLLRRAPIDRRTKTTNVNAKRQRTER